MLIDKQRLRRRTQPKRTSYEIFSSSLKPAKVEDEGAEREEGEEEVGVANDIHLKDYNEEIFDDDDFYHQVSHFKRASILNRQHAFLHCDWFHQLGWGEEGCGYHGNMLSYVAVEGVN